MTTEPKPDPIKFLSVCAGIEAASEAWKDLLFAPAGFCEIEPFPCCVLAHRHGASRPLHMLDPGEPGLPPEEVARRNNAIAAVAHLPERGLVPNLGDMSRFKDWPTDLIDLADVDLLVGGTPCQAFSVAGLRRSLEDARGSLSLTYIKLLDYIDEKRNLLGRPPALCLWENVPGVLNTADNAFGCFLGGLAGADGAVEPPNPEWGWPNAGFVAGPTRTVAWRILDAQHFGVAQRRRRVFVVASARKGFLASSVLFESEGVRRDLAPSRRQGEPGSPGAARGAGADGGAGEAGGSGRARDGDLAGTLTAQDTPAAGQDALGGIVPHVPEVAGTLDRGVPARGGNKGYMDQLVTGPLTTKRPGDRGSRAGATDGLIPHTAGTLCAAGKAAGSATLQDAMQGNLIPVAEREINETVTAKWSKGSGGPAGDECGNLVTMKKEDEVKAFPWQSALDPIGKPGDISPTLIKNQTIAVAIQPGQSAQNGTHFTEELSPTLSAETDRGDNETLISYGAPVETTGHQGDHVVGDGDVAACLSAQGGNNGGGPGQILHTHKGEPQLFSAMPMNSGRDFKVRPVEVAQPVMAAGPGQGDQGGDVVLTPPDAQAINVRGREGGAQAEVSDLASLRAADGGSSRSHVHTPGETPVVDMGGGKGQGRTSADVSPTLNTTAGGHAAQPGGAGHVRRLTPVECERLQGFPDNHTLIPGDHRPRQGPDRDATIAYLIESHGLSLHDAETLTDCPDGPRYKACGNSMCTKVMKFLGQRIQMVLRAMKEAA